MSKWGEALDSLPTVEQEGCVIHWWQVFFPPIRPRFFCPLSIACICFFFHPLLHNICHVRGPFLSTLRFTWTLTILAGADSRSLFSSHLLSSSALSPSVLQPPSCCFPLICTPSPPAPPPSIHSSEDSRPTGCIWPGGQMCVGATVWAEHLLKAALILYVKWTKLLRSAAAARSSVHSNCCFRSLITDSNGHWLAVGSNELEALM